MSSLSVAVSWDVPSPTIYVNRTLMSLSWIKAKSAHRHPVQRLVYWHPWDHFQDQDPLPTCYWQAGQGFPPSCQSLKMQVASTSNTSKPARYVSCVTPTMSPICVNA